jgi:DNA-binding PadR family transcriptional regulator
MSLEHILLGLLREPQSGYDLKAAFDRSLNYFWPAELSQIYRILKRMESDRLLRSRLEASNKGPDRRVYALTRAGRRKLREWLAEGPKFGDERFTYLAQVFFMDERRDLGATLRFVEQMRETFRQRQATYRKIERDWHAGVGYYPDLDTDTGFHGHLTLRMGVHRVTAAIRWCDETIGRIKERMAGRSSDGGRKQGKRT